MHAQALSGMDSCVRDRSLFIAWGGGGVVGGGAEDLGLNKVKFSQSPFECYFTEVIPLIRHLMTFAISLPMSSLFKQI